MNQRLKCTEALQYKQEASVLHRSLEKQFQPRNSFLQNYDYTITLIKRKKNSSVNRGNKLQSDITSCVNHIYFRFLAHLSQFEGKECTIHYNDLLFSLPFLPSVHTAHSSDCNLCPRFL